MTSQPKFRADVAYHRCLEDTSYGHALYKQVLSSDLKPGTVGYFDNDSDWQSILQLDDEQSILNNPELSPIKTLKKKVAQEGPWGATVSDGVSGHSVDVKVDATTPDGCGGGLAFEFTSSVEESAILVTLGKITHSQMTETDKLRNWMFQNFEKVVKLSGAVDTVKRKGLWVVTKTYTAKEAAIAVLRSKDSKTSFGISAKVYGTEASPSASWWEGKKQNSWKVLEDSEGKHDVVLFMSGIWWIPSRNPLAKQWKAVEDMKNHRFLGGEDHVPIGVEFQPEITSTVTERILFEPYAIGKDENLSKMTKSKRSPLKDPNSEEEKKLDLKDDEDSDNEVQKKHDDDDEDDD